jgi:hypothetical protein
MLIHANVAGHRTAFVANLIRPATFAAGTSIPFFHTDALGHENSARLELHQPFFYIFNVTVLSTAPKRNPNGLPFFRDFNVRLDETALGDDVRHHFSFGDKQMPPGCRNAAMTYQRHSAISRVS